MFIFLRFLLIFLLTITSFSAFASSPIKVIENYYDEPDTPNNFFIEFKMKEFPKSDINVKIDCNKPIKFNPDNRRFEIIQKIIQWGCNKKFNVELNAFGISFHKKEIVKVNKSNEDINYHARVIYCPTYVYEFGFGNSYRWHKEVKPQPSKNPKEKVSVDVGVDTRYYYVANWTYYRVCKNIDKNNKSQVSVCKKVKSRAKGYFDDLVELTKMLYNLPTKNPTPYYKNIEITASSPQTTPATKYFGIDTRKFGWIEFSGQVFTEDGKMPQDAIVKLESVTTLVDNRGNYRIKYRISNKNETMHIDQDFILEKRINNLCITTIYDKLVANGKYYTIKIGIFGDSKPLANKPVF